MMAISKYTAKELFLGKLYFMQNVKGTMFVAPEPIREQT
jgi:hypothetical protein